MNLGPQWVSTKEILSHPEAYLGKSIILGKDHSLVSIHDCPNEEHECLNNLSVYEMIKIGNCWNVLTRVETVSGFNQIMDDMRVRAMSAPDSSGSLQQYIITGVLPDGTSMTFSHAE